MPDPSSLHDTSPSVYHVSPLLDPPEELLEELLDEPPEELLDELLLDPPDDPPPPPPPPDPPEEPPAVSPTDPSPEGLSLDPPPPPLAIIAPRAIPAMPLTTHFQFRPHQVPFFCRM